MDGVSLKEYLGIIVDMEKNIFLQNMIIRQLETDCARLGKETKFLEPSLPQKRSQPKRPLPPSPPSGEVEKLTTRNVCICIAIVWIASNGAFCPSNPVTYEQAIKMIVQAVGYGEDATQSGGYPEGFIKIATEAGLLENLTANRSEVLSRADIAIILSYIHLHYFNLWTPIENIVLQLRLEMNQERPLQLQQPLLCLSLLKMAKLFPDNLKPVLKPLK